MTDVTESGIYNSRYEIIRQIARGGMAEVYLARDLQLHRPVALKVLFRELSTDQAFVQRFRHEAQAAANLTHPNIVSVYDWGESAVDSTYFIVMEYVDGDPLSKMIRDRGSLDPLRAAEIGSGIAAGLAYAHNHGVIHRDVKPGNVLVTPEGTAKVTDFGIARGHNTDTSLTQTGAVMGTATYFSPEQAQGERVDARSDIYSLAVVLYEMVTGKPPFSGDNPIAIATKHVQEAPKPPTELDPTIPDAFEAIVMKAMAKEPADRYQSADELHGDLTRFATGGRVTAPSYDPSVTAFFEAGAPTTIVSPREQRTRITKPATTNGGVTPPTGVPATSGPARTGSRLAVMIVGLIVVALVLGIGGYLIVRGIGTGAGSNGFDVPNVVSMSLPKAEAKLVKAGLKPRTTMVSSADSPLTVVSQNPSYPEPVARGDTVMLTVSRGGKANLPSLVGSTKAAAEAALKKDGFLTRISPKTVPCSQVGSYASSPTIGTVLSQSPAGGAQPVGSTVVLTVSQGVAVPNVVGQSSDAASNVLGQCDLNVGTTTDAPSPASSNVPQDDVISTSPVAGSLENPGTNINLTISSGAGVQVQNVVGDTLSQAETTITNQGLNYAVAYQTATNAAQIGTIIAQSPQANTVVSPNATVTITEGEAASPSTSSTSSSTSSSTTPSGTGGGTGGDN